MRGRLPRAALESIWRWIQRDLMPDEAATYREQVGRPLLEQHLEEAERAAFTFQDQAVACMAGALAAAEGDEKALRRLSAQIGTPRALHHVRTVIDILKARNELAALGDMLPAHIRNLADAQLDNVKAVLDSLAVRHPDTFGYALVIVMGRLASHWHLIRLAIKAVGSDKAARIADTSYSVAVTIVLAETERMVAKLAADLKQGRHGAVVALLKSIHDAVRGVRTELDLQAESPAGRQLAAIRSEISGVVSGGIEGIPGQLRRLLRPRADAEIPPGSMLDADDIADTEASIEFVCACRNYASELASSEVAQRVFTELQQYLDTGTRALLESLRHADTAHRPFRQSQVDAAVRFCAKMFGSEYAALLTKAAELAASGDRRPLRA
jgi:hypothetical protein